ncbi:ERF family protein [Spiroplasma endosymbiont of Tricholauxania praeusta]|uniref:ERF family protein n=1 Tax=Spiroplasma endosymbiont of Tricholauxania praeusta TaxID=3066296 RepID=UPI0030CD3E1F
MSKTSVYQKTVLKRVAIPNIPKNGFNKFGNYKYWLLSDIFNKFKLLCKELNIVIIHEDILTTDKKINYLDKNEVEISYFKRYTIIDLDHDKEIKYFDILACAKNTDIAKAKGSAETYAYRYFLMNLLLLSEDELDPDNDNVNLIQNNKQQNNYINNNVKIQNEKWEPSEKQLDYFEKYMITNTVLFDECIREDMERLNPNNNKDFLILMGKNYLDNLFNKLSEIKERFKKLKNNNKNEYRNYE